MTVPSSVSVCLPQQRKWRKKLLFQVAFEVGVGSATNLNWASRHGIFKGGGDTGSSLRGTPFITAPEILSYEPITTATDLWNVGVIAYMLLTHESPFAGADIQETYLNISQVNVDYSDDTFASVSPLAKDFIQKLLVKNPE
uniref:Serine/threonine-protein kinase 17B n=1 Tax=Sphaerodactylus townsendi TaxID=933632 RepID=A0ACB8FZG3_9SAUR